VSGTAADRDWVLRVPIGSHVGDWEITEPVAAGNFGSVYAARHVGTGDQAALKFMATGPMGQRQYRDIRELAEREIAFSRHAQHDHLVSILDSFAASAPDTPFDGAIVLVMERAEQSLQDLLDGTAVPDAARLIVEICAGLAYLHQAGWVHGDLKPSNVLIRADGSACLADFGLVTRVEGTHGYGVPLGSTDYTPPERAGDRLGERGLQIRPSADVWALGVTAHQILTGGVFPFPGPTPGARAAAGQEYASGRAPLRVHPDVGEGWRELITRCLSPDHTRRPAAADLLAQARSAAEPTRRRRSRRTWVLALAAAPVLALGTAGVVWAAAERSEHPAPQPSRIGAPLLVYNAEAPCRENPQRMRTCSMGLALDPRKPYAAGNVSQHRVWNGDQLVADCVLYNGQAVADEYGVTGTTWYRVATDVDQDGHAWLPAVRTQSDAKALPICPD
jgi:hypothetical protein